MTIAFIWLFSFNGHNRKLQFSYQLAGAVVRGLAQRGGRKVVQAMNGDGARLFLLPASAFNLRGDAWRDMLVF
ncbi:hypothetical protein [Serratia entomophila]|uniref:hypothetical protein n=1 Tax=Serratia entomophila TaxID=42906 RepID=UPI0021BB88B1|nr:hypothetical protein [Serratia entomophila]